MCSQQSNLQPNDLWILRKKSQYIVQGNDNLIGGFLMWNCVGLFSGLTNQFQNSHLDLGVDELVREPWTGPVSGSYF